MGCWNAANRDARVRVEITPGERFGHLIETFFGARTARAHRRQGHAASVAARSRREGVQRRDRVPFAAAGGAARDLWRAGSDRALARLSRDIPAAVAHRARASDVAG